MTSEIGRQQIWETVSGTQAVALYDILRKYTPLPDGEPSIPELHMSSVPRPRPGIRPSSSRSFEPDALASPASTESFAPETAQMTPPTGTADRD